MFRRFSSHCVFSSPFLCVLIMLYSIGFVQMRDFGDQRVIWVGINQHWTDWKQHFWYGQSRRPLIFQDIQADASIWVDVAVIYPCCECHLWWFEGIISWEGNVQKEHTSSIRWIIWPHNSCLPMELILLVSWTGRTVGRWIFTEVNKFFLNSLKSHINFLLQFQI